MDKSFLEKRIENKAENRLDAEISGIIEQMEKSSFFRYLKIDGKNLVGSDCILERRAIWIKNEAILKAVEERRKKLIEEESNNILSRLKSINYLFEQQL